MISKDLKMRENHPLFTYRFEGEKKETLRKKEENETKSEMTALWKPSY